MILLRRKYILRSLYRDILIPNFNESYFVDTTENLGYVAHEHGVRSYNTIPYNHPQ